VAETIYDIPVTTIRGDDTTLAQYRGRVLLIANVASECGFTPQYAGLERLYQEYCARGFAVLGFPCDQFGGQEPGSEAEIEAFCSRAYNVTFPMFAKVDVKGAHAHPLFRYLTRERRGVLGSRAIKWNFTKFLVSRDGAVLQRYAPTATPEQIAGDVAALLLR
jgi:glutathione peroxidase